MNIIKISIILRRSDVFWDYKSKNGRDFWDDLIARLESIIPKDCAVTDTKSNFQHLFYFTTDVKDDILRKAINEAVAAVLQDEESIKNVIVFVGQPHGSELSKLKEKNADKISDNEGFWDLADRIIDKENESEQTNEAAEEAPKSTFINPKAQYASVDTADGKESKPAEDITEEKKQNAVSASLFDSLNDIRDMKNKLLDVIHGQRHAIDETVQAIFESRMFAPKADERKGPLATLLFAGPSGVGKTFLASRIEEHLKCKMLVVDMSEYSDNLANNKFNGEHGCPAVVTGFVRENPNGIIIFDEIEKAHINTIHLFLQILDDARLMDHHIKQNVSFKDNIIIMTTNAGHSLYEDTTVCDLSQTPRNVILDALRKDINPATKEPFFPECITTRMANGKVILFNHLEPFALMDIVKDEVDRQLRLFKSSAGISVDYDPKLLSALLLYSGGGVCDARSLKGLAKNTVVKELQEILLQFADRYHDKVNSLENITFTIDTRGDEDVTALFENKDEMHVAIFAGEKAKEFTTVYADASSNTVFEIFDDCNLFKRKIRGVVDYILIDPFCGTMPSEKSPNDIEDINSDGMEIFRYVREYNPEVPVYILNLQGKEDREFDTLLAKGARGVIRMNPDNKEDFEKSLEELSLYARINNGVYSLGRTGRVLSFNCAQYLIDETTAVVSFEKLQLKSAPAAGDASQIARKGENNNIMFKDVVGCRTAKATLSEYCKALDDPRETALKGKKMPRGVLLYGPPGTGKTLLAKAMANECRATFFPVSATSFFGSLVGETEKNIENLFKKARKYAPSVIFIDEVDAIARKRVGSPSTSHNEDALNTFLAQMDGFVTDEKRPVFILAATNYDINGDSGRVLDSAFVRRFDSKINIPLPDTDDRYELILMSLKKHGIHFGDAHEKIVRNMAERTGGMSNADLEMMNASFARTVSDDKPDGARYMDALDAFRFGDVNKMDPDHLRQTACHEAGHAIVCKLCGTTPSFLTIVSRGDFGGYMESAGSKNSGTYTYSELMDVVCRCLAGRVAEIELYGEGAGINTGASSDIQKARYYIKACLGDFAMGDNLFAHWKPQEAEELMRKQYNRTKEMLSMHRDTLIRLTDLLAKEKSLDKKRMEEFFASEGI